MLISHDDKNRVNLHSPTELPRASTFLWNKHMMIQVNCRGYAVSQFMQPEPAKYSHAPNLEAKTFMQPEQPYYAHHPGRFVYIKDEDTGDFFSAPYEPVRNKPDHFIFSAGKSDIRWQVKQFDLEITFTLQIPYDRPIELWSLNVKNLSGRKRNLSITPYFSVGYMSWMNQSADFVEDLQGIVCRCITPYQKYTDYFKVKEFKYLTFFIADKKPDSWELQQEVFEGEGGLNNPDGLKLNKLNNTDSRYETPACITQYKLEMDASASESYRFIFGPAKDHTEIQAIREKYLSEKGFETAAKDYQQYIEQGDGCLSIETPDTELNHYVNHWLGRQVFYHGDVNRLTTDPQTRNYLQDNMGMSYVKPEITRSAFIHALKQQEKSGAMPDGILLHKDATLKYINQVPHTDHCVWLPVCLQAYLDETNDYTLLNEQIPYSDDEKSYSVYDHISRAMHWLINDRDERGLSFIAQGDWCDPMNMVGPEGKGVSGWLTVATAYALKIWSNVATEIGKEEDAQLFAEEAKNCNEAANKYLWDGDWYARGITDNDITFGIKGDTEGRIFLNPQSWSLLSGAATESQAEKIINAAEAQLETPYGVAMLAPAFTAMREDIGRVTQKFPGSAENGSVYNHAAAFYIYALYSIGKKDRAYKIMRQMIPGPNEKDFKQRGQMPVFIPNYYRGAYYQFPDRAGRSSQLFNTGTVHWFYRCLIDGLFGVRGCKEGLKINPQLPDEWQEAKITRKFRGAIFNIYFIRDKSYSKLAITCDGTTISGSIIKNIETARTYQISVSIP